ncbi:MAG TPA: hypothetical protein VN783_15395 [Thermoanaerobaculia bacterium]|nr:hypothetical protein [Thermoanaerobaculia bacterium]
MRRLLALGLHSFVLPALLLACREEGVPVNAPATPAPAKGAAGPPPIDPERPTGVVIGRGFAPDGSIERWMRTDSFAHGERIHLAVEAGALPGGTEIRAVWSPPAGAKVEQALRTIGGEPFLSLTAPSAGWPAGAGHVDVLADGRRIALRSFRIGALSRVKLPDAKLPP